MKILILSLMVISSINFADAKEGDCESMNHPKYQDEYNACKKMEKALIGEAIKNCRPLNHPNYQDEYNLCLKVEKDLTLGAENKASPCSGMNHPKYQTEYKLCLKLEIEQSIRAEKTCAATKKFQPFYTNYTAASQLGIVKPGQSFTGVYKAVDYEVGNYINSSCATDSLDEIVGNAKQVCYNACDRNSAAFLNNKKSEKIATAKQCSVVCDINQMAQMQFVAGMDSVQAGSDSSECSNQSKDSISNLNRAAKKIEIYNTNPADKDSKTLAK